MIVRSVLALSAAMLLCSGAANAAHLRSYSDDEDPHTDRNGVFAGVSGGVGLQIFSDSVNSENDFAYAGELKLGYSFGPPLQLFLSLALDGSSTAAGTFRNVTPAVYLQYHLISRPNVGVYARGGVGAAFSNMLPDAPGQGGIGLSFGGGLGLEIRVAPDLFIAPELFYRQTSLSATGSAGLNVASIGLTLGVIYY